MKGHIFQINYSAGGVPKLATAQAVVDEQGIREDTQREAGHGGSERALCLFSLEEILALQEEGHPIFPGAIGENVTVAGIDWEKVVPGARLRLGPDLEIEVTSYTTPCATIKAAFREGDYSVVAQKRRPGHSRVYARVLEAGEIRPGDPVILLEGAT